MRFLSLILSSFSAVCLQAELYFTPQMIAHHLEAYDENELRLLEKDLSVVRSVCFDGARDLGRRFYLATAGGPGARKTTILEKFLADHPEYQGGVYIDPDARTLRFMVHTYYAQSLNPRIISKGEDYDQVIRDAYHRWRPGSNYIALTLLEEAAAARYSVVHGTTATGAHVPHFFKKLKENGYEIVLLLCSCPDSLRKEAINYRNQEIRFYQSSPEDAVTKGLFFSQRMGAYFADADLMYFYWSDDLSSPERLAGVWRNGRLEVIDPEAMQRFIEKYEADRVALAGEGTAIPSFESYLSE